MQGAGGSGQWQQERTHPGRLLDHAVEADRASGCARGADRCCRAGTFVDSASLSTGGTAFSLFVLSTLRPPMAPASSSALATAEGPSDAVTSAFTASRDAALASGLFGSVVASASETGASAAGPPAIYWFAKWDPITVARTERKMFRMNFEAYFNTSGLSSSSPITLPFNKSG
jgi:hypothetical protein